MAHPLRFGGSEYRIQWLSNAGIINLRNGGFHHIRITGFHDRTDGVKLSGILNNVSPLPCSHPACSEFCVHLEFLPEIVCKVGNVYKLKKCVQLFTLFTIISTFAERKKTGYLPFTIRQLSSLHFAFLKSNILSRIIFSSLVPSDKPYSLA